MSIFSELGGALRQAEDYVRRHSKSKAVKAAEKRLQERKTRDLGRRVARGAAFGGVSGAGVACLAVLTANVPGLIVAGAGALAVTIAAMAWPLRRATDGPFSTAEMEALPGEAETWLLARRLNLPLAAYPPFDTILTHLGDLQACLGSIDPASTFAWDARRLIGSHLPGLVESWCELPSAAKAEDPEHERRLVDGLGTLARELGDLSREANRERLMRFETHGRFIESKYRDPV
jgi:hypothetical protein